jgi:23S rRNA pseudouridine1911/1915/1917 synthase
MTGDLSAKFIGRRAFELVSALTGLDETISRQLISFGSLWLDNRPQTDPEFALKAGVFRLNLPAYGPKVFYEIDPNRIVYSDRDLMIYHKEAGRPSQGVPHDGQNNVLAAMERQTGLVLRLPHRLDAATSGFLILAVTRQAAGRLGKAFEKGRVAKRYLALCQGEPPNWTDKTTQTMIAKDGPRYVASTNGPGLRATTRFTVLGAAAGQSLFLAEPLTGRTHQIRVHLAFEGYPIIGDTFYGGAAGLRLMLRASGLRLAHPGTGRMLVLGGPWSEEEITGPK